MNGTIFDIKEFSIHDGPGARVTVFLKGCPLRCQWCHNPEGLSVSPQLMYKENLCSHCGKCFVPCTHPECASPGRCVHACANGCLSITGKIISSQDLADKLAGYHGFFRMAGGGITFSGGEPLLQADFVIDLIRELKMRMPDIHTAIQTSGYAQPETYRKVISCVDYVMQDIKLADPKKHLQYTGVSNQDILENIRWLKESGKRFVFRIPLIPGITDTMENLTAIAELAEAFPVELLKYNALAGAKYEMLNMTYPLASSSLTGNPQDEGEITALFQNASWG